MAGNGDGFGIWPETDFWLFFWPQLPKFPLNVMKDVLDLADAAVILHQNQPGMRRELT